MISKAMQVGILQNYFNTLGAYNYELIDEYSEIDEIRRHNEQTQAEVQAGEITSTIYGIVQTLPSQLAPIENLESIQSTQLITFFVPNWTAIDTDPLGVEAKAIIQDLNEIAMRMAGKSDIELDSSYVLSPSLPVVGQETNMLGYYAVDVSLSIGWQMMTNGVISNAVKVSIFNDTTQVYDDCLWLDLSINRTRVPDPINRAGSQELETHIIQQGLTINMALPLQYNADNESLSWVFYKDGLYGSVDKKYKVKIEVNGEILERYFVATQISSHLAVGQVGSVSVELSYAAQ